MIDLHVHPIKFVLENKTLSTKAFAITGDKQSTREMQGKLFKLTTDKARERKKRSQTGQWFFVPFSEDGKVSKSQIAQLVREQNTLLQNEINIAMTGLQNLHSPVT
eukprot:15336255-Ditylum_brightwellii.AAC.1